MPCLPSNAEQITEPEACESKLRPLNQISIVVWSRNVGKDEAPKPRARVTCEHHDAERRATKSEFIPYRLAAGGSCGARDFGFALRRLELYRTPPRRLW